MADDNGNPFDTPLASEVSDHQQAQATTAQASDNGNPFEEPLMSEKAEAANAARTDGAQIAPVTSSTNPKLAAAESAKDMPEYVGAVGAAGAGLMASSVLTEATAPVLRHIATEYGQPALKAMEEAAKAHPIVAKVLEKGLEAAGGLTLAKYMNLFGKK